MDTLSCIKTRRTIRKFLEVPVEREKLGNILNAGRLAPSAGNLQDWRFVVVFNEEKRKSIAEACQKQYWMELAPIHIIVCSDSSITERFYGKVGKEKFSLQQAGAVIENMLLTAHSEGLGSAWVGAIEEDMLRRSAGISDSITIHAVIAIGYSDEEASAPNKLDLENITYINDWGSKIEDYQGFMGYTAHKVKSAAKKSKKFFHKIKEHIQKVKKIK